MKYLVLLSLFLTGCGGIPLGMNRTSPEAALSAGAVGGIALTKTAEKVREVFTPKYPLYVTPHEICDISSSIVVTCTVIPCKENCQKIYRADVWNEKNPIVMTVSHSLVGTVVTYCGKNQKACIMEIGQYSGETIVIVKD